MSDPQPHLGEALSALLDGELDDVERAAAEAHLAGCDRCRAELRQTAAVRDAVRRLAPLDLPGALLRRLGAQASQDRPLAWVAVAAAIVAVLLFTPVADEEPAATASIAGVGAVSGPTAAERPEVVVADRLVPPYQAPAELAPGYVRLGVYRRGAATHVMYGDGVDTLSVFEEPGRLDRRDAGASDDGHLITWKSGPLVFTVVGDGPEHEVRRAAASVPEPRSLSPAQRVRRAARALVDVLSGRR